MVDYIEDVLGGLGVRVKSSNPANPTDGEVWFNSTADKLRYNTPPGPGVWATGGDLNTGRRIVHGGAGTVTAALFFGGNIPTGSPAYSALNESYNGTSWTEVADLNKARDALGGSGLQTAALAFGGFDGSNRLGNNESWNGSAWTEVADLNEARKAHGAGTQTATLAFGGEPPSGAARGVNESWNGSAWTEVADLNAVVERCGCTGTTTAALAFGGDDASGTELTKNEL